MARRKKITLQTLADELGVSVQTISKALHGKPGMSAATRLAILRTAADRGYVTLEQMQALAVDKVSPYPVFARRFALIASEQSLNYNRLLQQGLKERYLEFGHTVDTLLLTEGARPVKQEADSPDAADGWSAGTAGPEEEAAGQGEGMKPGAFAEWVDKHQLLHYDGIFIAPRLMPPETEERLLTLPMPRILLNYPPPLAPVDSVIWDVATAVHMAVAELVRHGHRSIMYVGDIESQRGFVLRWQAFGEAMRAHGLPVLPERHAIAGRGGHSRHWREELAERLQAHRPTAVLCGIDEEAAAVYDICSRCARIPAELSMVALLNEQTDHLPRFARPLLAIREAACRAADRMLWRIANPTLPYEHVRVRGEWVPGGTLAPAPAADE